VGKMDLATFPLRSIDEPRLENIDSIIYSKYYHYRGSNTINELKVDN